jgi:hypothetical protein
MEYDHTDNSNTDYEDDEDLQPEFPDWAICPLTLEVMNDPLMNRDGLNYERKAILEWLNRGHTTCPLTRKPLSYHLLAPNAQLKLRINNWKRQHNLPVTLVFPKEHEEEDCKFSILLDSDMKLIEDAVVAHFLTEQRRVTTIPTAIAALNNQQREQRLRHGRSSARQRTNESNNNGNNDDPASISPRSRRRSVLSILDAALSVVRGDPREEE